MKKLTKGQIEGIRLIADLFVIDDMIKNVFNKDPALAKYSKQYREHLQKEVPTIFMAEAELKRQIELVRKEWRNNLENDPSWQASN